MVNLGAPETIPDAMRADTVASQMAGATYQAIDGAAHFSALPKCSPLGVLMIGLAGDDNICSDKGLREDVHGDIKMAISAFLEAISD